MKVVRTKDNKNEKIKLDELGWGKTFDHNGRSYLCVTPILDEYNNKYNCVSLEEGDLDFIDYDTDVVKTNLKAMEAEK